MVGLVEAMPEVGGYKVRLGDGSEIGPMDLSALKTWKLQGLIDGDSPVHVLLGMNVLNQFELEQRENLLILRSRF